MKRIKKGSTLILVNKKTEAEEQVKVISRSGNTILVEDPEGIQKTINILEYVIIILTYADRIWNLLKSIFKRNK